MGHAGATAAAPSGSYRERERRKRGSDAIVRLGCPDLFSKHGSLQSGRQGADRVWKG